MLARKAVSIPLCLVIWGCASQTQDPAMDPGNADLVRQELTETYRIHEADLVAGDLPAVEAIYTPDIVIRRAGGPPIRGYEAMSEFFSAFYAAFSIDSARYSPEEVDVYGDTAWEFGTYMWATRPNEGSGEAVDYGNYLVKWKRQADGSWKVHRNIFNSTVPPQDP